MLVLDNLCHSFFTRWGLYPLVGIERIHLHTSFHDFLSFTLFLWDAAIITITRPSQSHDFIEGVLREHDPNRIACVMNTGPLGSL